MEEIKDLDGESLSVAVTGLTHFGTPVFCEDMNLYVVDTGDVTRNPIEKVKLNGEFGLLTRDWNHTSDTSDKWWMLRDPSRNFEYGVWTCLDDGVDTNKIYFYWDDPDNLPTVEYAQRDDCVYLKRVNNCNIKLKVQNAGVGVRLYNCHNNTLEIEVDDCGRGVLIGESTNNLFNDVQITHAAVRGFHFSHQADNNTIENAYFANIGLSSSMCALFFSSEVDGNICHYLVADGVTYGRYWQLDGEAITFGERSSNNVVEVAIVANQFSAVADNSGYPGNSVKNLTVINCTNTADQKDIGGYGNQTPIEELLPNTTCINSGPFGVRTEEIPNCRLIGDCGEWHSRYFYPVYQDMPDYWTFSFRNHAVNLVGPIPSKCP
jgi:hypothetical protein